MIFTAELGTENSMPGNIALASVGGGGQESLPQLDLIGITVVSSHPTAVITSLDAIDSVFEWSERDEEITQ